MTGPLPPVSSPGGPEGQGGDRIALGRAAVLLVVAIVVGVLCLQVGARQTVNTAVASSTTTTTTPPSSHSTTTTTSAPNPSVKVLVANGSSVDGAAAYFTSKLGSAGWSTLTPADSTAVSTSTVYYAAGQQQSAERVAATLGLSSSAVRPVATAPSLQGSTGADVEVIIGPDLGSQVTTTTTTTAAPASTSTSSTSTSSTSTSSTSTSSTSTSSTSAG